MSLNENYKDLGIMNAIQRFQLIKDRAFKLFEGNQVKAEAWLNTSLIALNTKTPVEYASTLDGAIEVLKLINRLEYGEFT